MHRKNHLLLAVLLLGTLKIYGQTDSTKKESCLKERPLEVKFEFYPMPLFPSFNNKTIKIEAIVNYHNVLFEKVLYGVHFYYDGNTHWKEHKMEDLLSYSEIFVGAKKLQFGLEVGSLSGQEYVALGPQITLYNFCKNNESAIFERFSGITRTYMLDDSLEHLKKLNYVIGYEYSTHGLPLWDSKKFNVELASTGMGRILLPTHQRVVQASVWMKFVPRYNTKRQPIISFGLEWENNTALTKAPHEVYFGIEIDL